MKIYILSVANKMPNWVNGGCLEYLKRFSKSYEIVLKEIKPERRHRNQTIETILLEEELKIREAIPHQSSLIILDEKGQAFSTIDFTNLLVKWQNQSTNPCFIIGSADGISPQLKQEGLLMQLSKMTFPHALAKIILIEQLYRAVSTINHHPYHRT